MLTLMVYSRGFVRQGALGDWADLDLTVLRNRVGEVSVTAPAAHPKAANLREEGSRLVITDDETGDQIFTGTVRGLSGSGPGDDRVRFRVSSDHTFLTRTLAWPNPTLPLSQQGLSHQLRNLPLETILKTVVSQNATRLGLPLTVAPDLGRGEVTSRDFRFHPILDHLQSRLDASNLTITFEQVGAGVVMDVREAATVRKELSVTAGTLTAYDWELDNPLSTRAIVAGQGEGAARALDLQVSTMRETALGWAEETFVDARDIELAADLPARGQDQLREDRPSSGLSLTLSQTPSFRYGVHYRLGDLVTVQTPTGPISDHIRQLNLSFTRDAGQVITPLVGERRDDPDLKLAQRIRQWATRVAALERR